MIVPEIQSVEGYTLYGGVRAAQRHVRLLRPDGLRIGDHPLFAGWQSAKNSPPYFQKALTARGWINRFSQSVPPTRYTPDESKRFTRNFLPHPTIPMEIYLYPAAYDMDALADDGKAPAERYVVGAPAIVFDLDMPSSNRKTSGMKTNSSPDQSSIWKAVNDVCAAGLNPSFVVFTGEGAHLYYLLKSLAKMREAKEAAKIMAPAVSRASGFSATMGTDINHAYRLAGSVHTPTGRRAALLCPDSNDEIIRYDLKDLVSRHEPIDFNNIFQNPKGQDAKLPMRIKPLSQTKNPNVPALMPPLAKPSGMYQSGAAMFGLNKSQRQDLNDLMTLAFQKGKQCAEALRLKKENETERAHFPKWGQIAAAIAGIFDHLPQKTGLDSRKEWTTDSENDLAAATFGIYNSVGADEVMLEAFIYEMKVRRGRTNIYLNPNKFKSEYFERTARKALSNHPSVTRQEYQIQLLRLARQIEETGCALPQRGKASSMAGASLGLRKCIRRVGGKSKYVYIALKDEHYEAPREICRRLPSDGDANLEFDLLRPDGMPKRIASICLRRLGLQRVRTSAIRRWHCPPRRFDEAKTLRKLLTKTLPPPSYGEFSQTTIYRAAEYSEKIKRSKDPTA